MNKRLLALLVAMLMIVVSVGAMAENPQTSISISKTYNSETGVIPADSLTFTATAVGFVNAAGDADDVPENTPVMTGDVTFSEADGATFTENVVLDFSQQSFSAVGVYTYSVTESSSTPVQGVDYSDTVEFRVLVGYDDAGNIVVQNVQISESENGKKKGGLTNTLKASGKDNALTIKKIIAGNMGDTKDTFVVQITVTAANGRNLSGLKSVKVNDEEVPVLNGVFTITVGHNETYEITGIPVGAQIAVVETNKVDHQDLDNYKASYASTDDSAQNAVAGTAEMITITNTRDQSIDTGVNTDVLPYVMLMAIVAAGAVIFLMKRRAIHE